MTEDSMPVATDSDLHPDDDAVATGGGADEIDEEGATSEPATDDADSEPKARSKKRMSAQRWATLLSLTVIVALSVLVGWLGFRVHQSQKADAQRSQFLQVARQGALNLTTIDWQDAHAEWRRVLDGGAGGVPAST